MKLAFFIVFAWLSFCFGYFDVEGMNSLAAANTAFVFAALALAVATIGCMSYLEKKFFPTDIDPYRDR